MGELEESSCPAPRPQSRPHQEGPRFAETGRPWHSEPGLRWEVLDGVRMLRGPELPQGLGSLGRTDSVGSQSTHSCAILLMEMFVCPHELGLNFLKAGLVDHFLLLFNVTFSFMI